MDQSGFAPQPYKVRSGVKGLKLLCSEDEQSRTCWIAAFRLFKVSPSWRALGGSGGYQSDAGGVLRDVRGVLVGCWEGSG